MTRAGLAALTLSLSLGLLAPVPAGAFYVNALEAGVFDPGTGEWVYEKKIDKQVPVASITKILAAITFLERNGDLDELITIRREDWVKSGKTRLRIGDRVSARMLIQLALVSSDNCAARALAHPFALSRKAYGFLMQQTAYRLGCRDSFFTEPSGLDHENVSTVRDIVRIFTRALNDDFLGEVLGMSEFTLQTERGKRRIVHSSRFLRFRRDVVAAKTGYLVEAGYCLVQCSLGPDGHLVTVILGAPTKGARTRETARLLDYGRRKTKRNS